MLVDIFLADISVYSPIFFPMNPVLTLIEDIGQVNISFWIFYLLNRSFDWKVKRYPIYNLLQ